MTEEMDLEQDMPEIEPGPDRQAGVAGPQGLYIERALTRWHLRGDGYLK